MGLFGAIIGTVVEVAKLPVTVAADVVTAPFDLMDGKDVGQRTVEKLEDIKDEADKA